MIPGTSLSSAPRGGPSYPCPESNRVTLLRREGSRSAAKDKYRAPVRFERILTSVGSVHAVKRRRPIQGRGTVDEEGFEPTKPRRRIYRPDALNHLHTRQ